MNNSEYHSLINDTLTYTKELLPQKDEPSKVHLPPTPPKPKSEIKPKLPPKPIVEVTPPLVTDQEKKETKKIFIELEMPKSSSPPPTEEIRRIFKEIDPDLYFHESIPSDYKAKRIKEAWKEKRSTPAIPIFFQGTQFRSFIQRIAKAIDTVYGSCRLVEITPQKKWDLFLESENLKLIIAPDTLIFGNKELLPFYQETPQQKKRTLGNIPLLLLPDLNLYYKDPYLKRSLWNVICNTINSLPSS
ncbi:MAG: hypothetical protein P0S93_06160 [Candidatus Neptunochlamydia sp.]|nr:hypothetical protein [Candidatus Neptunochlamydia sp.]